MKDFKNYTADAALPDELQKTLSSLSGKEAKELLPILFSEATKARKNGTLSDREIDDFFQKVSPMLNPVERATCLSMIEKLKAIASDGARG